MANEKPSFEFSNRKIYKNIFYIINIDMNSFSIYKYLLYIYIYIYIYILNMEIIHMFGFIIDIETHDFSHYF